VDLLRVLIVDDHPDFRGGMRALLASTPGIEVAGEAATGEEAIDLATGQNPDVVLMDLQLPGMGGIEATRRIVAARPEARVLVVTMYEEDALIVAAMRAGARGYVLKGAGPREMVRAVQAAGEGSSIFSPTVGARLAGLVAGDRVAPFPGLTERERDVLDLMAGGRGNAAIAARLGVRVKTVRNHVSTILGKLDATDRADAILRAREAGLGRGG
jgi:DNA-binding NarL/FixJ family response regulator